MNCDVLVVGAGCAGLTAAIYAARAGRSVLVLEQAAVGGQIAYSPRVENYPGIPSVSGAAFADALLEQAEALGVRLELETAERLLPGRPHTVVTDCGSHTAAAVVVAVGAQHRRLGVPGEETLSGVSYCAVCDGAFYRGRDVAVVGGGSTALESAEFLAGLCRSVRLIHRRDAFRGEPQLAARVLALPNVTAELGCTVQALAGDGAVAAVVLDGPGGRRTVPADGVFVCIGQEPGTAAFADVLTLDGAGYVAAGEDCRTNVPGVFAAGDCRAKAVRQLTTAAADGSVAALAAAAACAARP